MMVYLLAAFVYLQIGFHFGRIGADVWRRADNHSTRSFLLFPVRHCSGRVGKTTSVFGQGVHDEECMAYRTLMLFVWPIITLVNAVTIAFLGPSWIAARGKRRESAWAVQLAESEAANRIADEEIARLESETAAEDGVRMRVMPIRPLCEIRDDFLPDDPDPTDEESASPPLRRNG